MTEPAMPLFDPARTTTAKCVLCAATRAPDETKAKACEIDYRRRNLEEYGGGWIARPPVCLNQPQPSQDIPY